MSNQEIAEFLAFLIVLCMAITIGVLVWWKRRREQILLGPFAIATVTSFQVVSAGKNGPRHQTGLRFRTPLGEEVDVRHLGPTSGRVPRVGEQLHLHHDAKRPKRFMLDGDERGYRTLHFALMLALLVDVLILVGIGLYLAGFVEL